MHINPNTAATQAPAIQHAAPARPRDADGDHDGTPKAAAPTRAPALATSGAVGTKLHAVA